MATLVDYALTTVADVKETLGISGSSQDNLIIRKINLATDVIEAYCTLPYGHHFKQATYTNEEYDGTGSDQLILKMRPVVSISSFQTRDSSENTNDWDDNDAERYFLDSAAGVIDLLSSQNLNWNRSRITYIAGYDPIPAALSEAAATLAAFWVDNATSGTNVKKKQEGARSIEYFQDSGDTSDSIVEQLNLGGSLDKYKNYTLLENK